LITLTVDKIISYASSLGTFISALAALYAIWLTIFQRRISYKPTLVMNSKGFKIAARDFTRFQFDIIEESSPLSASFSNIGLGTAMSLKYHWNFDYIKAQKKYLELLLKKTGQEKHSFDVYYQYGNLSIKQEKIKHMYNTFSKPQDVKFLLPYSAGKDTQNVFIPSPALIILSNIIHLSFLLNITSTFPISGPSLTIEYQDIEGNMKRSTWTTELQVHTASIVGDAIDADASLSFKLDSQNWASVCIEKIRKSYVNFIENIKPF